MYSNIIYLNRRSLKQSIENSNLKNKLCEAQKTNETLKRMLSHMPTVEIKHKLVVQQVIMNNNFTINIKQEKNLFSSFPTIRYPFLS